MSEHVLTAPTVPHARAVNIRGATLRAIYIIWKRDLIRYWRDRMRVVASLAQPVLFLFVFGSGLSSSLRGSTGGFGGPGSSLQYVQFIFPGIIGMSVLFTSIFGAMSIVWDREFGFLKEVLVAPIHRSAVAIGKTLGGATQAMFQGIVILVLAPLVGVKLTFLSVVELVPMIFLFAFALSALGVAVAARMRTMQGFQMVMNFLMMPMFFLAARSFLSGAISPHGCLCSHASTPPATASMRSGARCSPPLGSPRASWTASASPFSVSRSRCGLRRRSSSRSVCSC